MGGFTFAADHATRVRRTGRSSAAGVNSRRALADGWEVDFGATTLGHGFWVFGSCWHVYLLSLGRKDCAETNGERQRHDGVGSIHPIAEQKRCYSISIVGDTHFAGPGGIG